MDRAAIVPKGSRDNYTPKPPKSDTRQNLPTPFFKPTRLAYCKEIRQSDFEPKPMAANARFNRVSTVLKSPFFSHPGQRRQEPPKSRLDKQKGRGFKPRPS